MVWPWHMGLAIYSSYCGWLNPEPPQGSIQKRSFINATSLNWCGSSSTLPFTNRSKTSFENRFVSPSHLVVCLICGCLDQLPKVTDLFGESCPMQEGCCTSNWPSQTGDWQSQIGLNHRKFAWNRLKLIKPSNMRTTQLYQERHVILGCGIFK